MPTEASVVDTSQFTAMCEQLARLSGAKFEEVLNSEVASVLNMTISNTKMAKANKIIGRYNSAEFTMQPPSLYAPRLGKGGIRRGHRGPVQIFVTKKGRSLIKYNLTWKYPTVLWEGIQANRKESLHKKLDAIGLARKSFWLIGQALGLKVEGGTFTKAVAPDGSEHRENITTERKKDANAVSISFTNAQPTVNIPQVGGLRALKRAISGRVKYFNTNAEHAVFAEVKTIAAKYKGFTVNAR